MSYLLYALMAVAVVGIVFGWKKQKDGFPWGEKLMLAGAIVALVCAGMALKNNFFGSSTTGMMKAQLAYTRISGQYLGQYLAKKFPNSKVLIVVQPETSYTKDRPNPLLDGIKAGLGSGVTVVAEVAPEVPKMPGGMPGMMPMPPPAEGAKVTSEKGGSKAPPGMPSPEEMMMMGPIEMWLTPDRFDALLEPYAGKVDLVITTIGLPMQPGLLKFWKLEPLPKMVIAQGNVMELRGAIKAGAVAAALTFNPQAKFDTKMPPKDLEKAFNNRYLLITPENVDQIAEQHKDLFMNLPTP